MKFIFQSVLLFAAYFVILFGSMFLGFVSPYLWVAQPIVAAFLTAWPVVAMCKKWSKPGVVACFPAIYALLLAVMGEISQASVYCSIIALLIAAVALSAVLSKPKGTQYGYAICSLLPVCQLLPLWLDKKSYYAGAIEEMGSVEYAEGLMNCASPVCLILLVVCTALAGYMGARMAQRQFEGRA